MKEISEMLLETLQIQVLDIEKEQDEIFECMRLMEKNKMWDTHHILRQKNLILVEKKYEIQKHIDQIQNALKGEINGVV